MGEGLNRLVLVTGLSGAGRTTAVKALEDIGFYTVDNLPTALFDQFLQYFAESLKDPNVAIGLSVCNGEEISQFREFYGSLKSKFTTVLIFLEAADDVLLRRYKETRRFHPLLFVKGNLKEAIASERQMLEKIKDFADIVVDTSTMNSYALRRFIFDLFSDVVEKKFKLSITSFGFKKGIPSYLDMLFDVRCLPNPYYEEHLRDLDGRDERIRNFVFSSGEAKEFVDSLVSFLGTALEHLKEDGRLCVNVGFGCTGGVHRSVAVAEFVGYSFNKRGYRVSIYHRELGEYKELVG